MGFFDPEIGRFSESWIGRKDHDSNEFGTDILRTVEAKLKTLFTIQKQTESKIQSIGTSEEEIRWIKADSYIVGIGETVGVLVPVVALAGDAVDQSPAKRALVGIGMAYVVQQANEELFSRAQWRDRIAQTAMQVLSIDFVVVTARGEITQISRGPSEFLESCIGWNTGGNRLTVPDQTAQAALNDAIRAATSENGKTSIVPGFSSMGAPKFYVVTPFHQSEPPQAVVLFERDQTDHDKLRENLFDLYGLTRSERVVAQGILSGKTVADTAEVADLSVATVRSYMKQIFAKTGTHRQSELISLYYKSILPVTSALDAKPDMQLQ